MCRVAQCCCCCSLRVGAYLAAAYTIALGLLGAIISGVAVGLLNNQNFPKDNNAVTVAKAILYVTMIIYLLWLITAIIMIVGTSKSKRGFLLPWVVMTIILTVILAISILMSFISIGVTFGNATNTISFLLNVAIFSLNCYSLVAVMSFYKDNCVDIEPGMRTV